MGVHLGWASDGTDWNVLNASDSDDVDVNTNGDQPGTETYKTEREVGDVVDLLAFLKYDYSKVSPFIMLGFSSMDVKFRESDITTLSTGEVLFSSSGKDDVTLTGAKIVLGLEFPLGENVVFHALTYYADYGKESADLYEGDDKFEIDVDQTGIQVGIAYTF